MFWHKELQNKYLAIIKQFQAQIIIQLGSHIHIAGVKAPLSQEALDLNLVIFSSPSISPLFDNNPAYTIVRLEKGDDLEKGATGSNIKVYDIISHSI